jgi:hypothetical protein
MPNEFIIKNGFRSQGNSEITGSLNVSGSISTTSPVNLSGFATGSVLFTSGSAGAIIGSANLFWDNTNGRLGVGTSTPSSPGLGSAPSLINIYKAAGNSGLTLTVGTNAWDVANVAGTGIWFINNNSAKAILFNNGNLAINTTTDAGFKLDVNGTARVSGDFSLVLGNAIRFGTSLGLSKTFNQMLIYSGTGAGNVGGTDIHYWNGSTYVAGLRLNNNANVLINTTTDAGFRLDVNGTARFGATTIQAPGALSTDTAFRVRNSADSDNIISVQGNGVLQHTSLPSTTV